MKKGKAAGIGIAVIAAAIVFGIASLPDEVLLENPIDASENIPTQTVPTEFQPESGPVEEAGPEEAEPVEEAGPEEAEPVEEAEPEEEAEGNLIEVKISDGVGSGDNE